MLCKVAGAAVALRIVILLACWTGVLVAIGSDVEVATGAAAAFVALGAAVAVARDETVTEAEADEDDDGRCTRKRVRATAPPVIPASSRIATRSSPKQLR